MENAVYRIRKGILKDVSDRLMAAVCFEPGRRRSEPQFKMIEILDETKADKSPFLNLFSRLEGEGYPTVIKYRHELLDRLLIYVPRGMGTSALVNEFGKQLTEIYEEFYNTTERGRRKGSFTQKIKIFDLLKDLFGKHIPKYKLAKIAEERSQGKPKSQSVMRRHGDVLKAIKEGTQLGD